MAATPIGFATKDNASAALASGINASVLSIPLDTGDGALFPQAYTGTATSSGSSTTLNSTGILAAVGGSSSAMAGKFVWNKTDGSVAVIVSVATNALTCTRLLGGTDNTWDSSDVYCIDPFVITVEQVSTNAYGVQSTTQREEILITSRSTDTLTAPTGGRGYGSDPANTFVAGDSVFLHVTSPIAERLKDIVSVLGVQVNTNVTDIDTAETNITNLQTGSYHYVSAAGSSNAYTAATPALAAYAAGNIVRFKANHTNSGASTLNVNGLGAKTIKKNDGATDLSANDIVNGQIVEVQYDGTNFQMLSPVGTPATVTHYVKTVFMSATASATAGTSSTSEVDFDTHTYTISANDLVAGVAYEFEVFGDMAWASGSVTLAVKLGSTQISTCNFTPAANGGWSARGRVQGTAAAGGSVNVKGVIEAQQAGGANAKAATGYNTVAVATNGSLELKFSVQYGASSGSNGADIEASVIKKVSTTAFS